MLAYSSIENIGIVTLGLGAGVIFAALRSTPAVGHGFIAAFYHMLNHSLYKALLFLGAGAVDDRAGTRDLDKLGGLMRAMPWTAGAFLVGALAISAVPPFNGFVSEWLTLQTLLRSAEISSIGLRLVFVLCGAALALTAALAVTCFVKAFAMGFLGMPRSEGGREGCRSARFGDRADGTAGRSVSVLGVLPTYVIPALNRELQPLINPWHRQCVGAAVLYCELIQPGASASLSPGLSQSGRTIREDGVAWPRPGNPVARFRRKPRRLRHVAFLQFRRTAIMLFLAWFVVTG